MTAVLLVVFDGLRPDMIDADVTPNLVRFGQRGTRLPFARSVFPSETRVCTASIATGCHPRRHGVVANQIARPGGGVIDTGDAARLRAFEDESGSPLVQMPTLGERLAAAGRSFAVLSSGSTGQTYVLNPRAEPLGQITLSAHGLDASSPGGRALLGRLPVPPRSAPERAEWIAEAFRVRLLPDPPDATVLWLCEPDTSAHHAGLNSAPQQQALRRADAAFGRIVGDWEGGPQRDRLQIIVASDHGHTAITGHCDVAAALAEVREFSGCTLLAGSSAGIVVPGGESERIVRLATWLTRQSWCGSVLAASGTEAIAGVLPRETAMIDHARAAHILFTLRNDEETSAAGLPGQSLYDGALVVGAGTHGGLSRAEMRTVLMLGGSRIRPGWVSDWPAGLPDIAPTIQALLGMPYTGDMDGRVLVEAFTDGTEPAESRSPETWEGRAPGYAQVLARVRMGRHVWIDGAERYDA